jgi:ATP-dependent Clp protease protease subunit
MLYYIAGLALAGFLFAGGTHYKTLDISNTDTNRVVVFEGQVRFNVALPFAQSIDTLSKESRDPIYVLINSPGGDVLAGHAMVSAIKVAQARGVKVTCVSTLLSASMALHLLASCDERYALPHTLLLFHEARVTTGGGGLSPSELETLSEQIKILISGLERDLIAALGTDEATFRKHNIAETWWTGEAFNDSFPRFLTVIRDIKLPDPATPIF